MPLAVTHVILAIVLLDIFRDYIIKNRKKIPLHYIFIGGVAGLLPDIDVPLYWLLNKLLKIEITWFHRTFSHSIFFPLAFLAVTVGLALFSKNKKHWVLMAVITFGVSLHILLDGLFVGYITLFYPFSTLQYGFNFASRIAWPSFIEGLDAIILLVWLWDLDRRHKLRDFM